MQSRYNLPMPTLKQLEQGELKRQSSCIRPSERPGDVYVSFTEKTSKRSARIRFSFYLPLFKSFNYISFYVVENRCFFKLMKEDEQGTAYTLSGKSKNSKYRYASLNGDWAEILKPFSIDKYFELRYYDVVNTEEPIYYIKRYED